MTGGEEGVYEEPGHHTRTGRPLGEPRLVERLESLVGQVQRPGKRGPKRKKRVGIEPRKRQISVGSK